MGNMNLRFSPLDYTSATRTFDFNGSNIIGANAITPFLGKERYLVTSKSKSSNLYYKRLVDVHGIDPDDIYTSLATAYAAMTASQNDVLYVTPGAYDEDAEVAWSKSATHLVGLGGPNTHGDYSEPNCVIYTDAITNASTITVTGNNCQFINMTISNAGNNAACLTPLTANGYGGYYQNCSFQGNMQANQLSTVAAASLYVGGAGMFNQFVNCQIGNDQWGKRSGANSGQIRFTGTVQPNGIIFKDCRVVSWSATTTCAAVALPANGAVGRGLTFDNCMFYNLNDPSWTNMANVFYDNDAAGQTIVLKDCAAYGYAEWQANGAGADRRIFSNMGVATAGGGLMIEPTATIS